MEAEVVAVAEAVDPEDAEVAAVVDAAAREVVAAGSK